MRISRLNRTAWLCVALALPSVPAALPKAGPTAAILANESDNCQAWLVDQTPARRYWVFGYLSGLNAAWGGTYRSQTDALAKVEHENQVIRWMDRHCEGHPAETLQQAAHQFYRELVETNSPGRK